MDKSLANQVFQEFNKEWIGELRTVDRINIRDLERKLKEFRGTTIIKWEPMDKGGTRKFLNGWIKGIMAVAEEIRNSPWVHPQQLVQRMFFGEPVFDEKSKLIYATDEDGIHVIITEEEGASDKSDTIRKIYSLETDVKKKCLDIEYISQIDGSSNVVEMEDLLRASIERDYTEKVEEMQPLPPKTEVTSGSPTKSRHIGQLTTSHGKKGSKSKKGDFISGWLYEADERSLQTGEIIVAENNDGSMMLFCEVVKIVFETASAATHTKSVSEFITICDFKILYSYKQEDGKMDRIDNQIKDYSDFKIRKIQERDREYIGLTNSGTPIGCINGGEQGHIPLLLPHRKEFESMFIAGVQGSGKTNFLMYFVQSLLDREKPPAIVIFDVEGEFNGLSINLSEDLKRRIEEMGLDWNQPKDILKYSFKEDGNGSHTIPLSSLGLEDILMLTPDLPQKSMDCLHSMLQPLFEGGSQITKQMVHDRLDERLEYFTGSRMIADALRRFRGSSTLDIFDQDGLNYINIDEILQPGRITLLDLSAVDNESIQRSISLAILTMLERKKKNPQNPGPDLIVLFDEAHRFFPSNQGGVYRSDYIYKIGMKLSTIVHRGRKRGYGIIFATQSARDISPKIVELCNTKIYFRLGDIPRVIAADLPFATGKLTTMNTGEAIVLNPGTPGYKISIPRVK